ncbi:hypothetical protein ABIA33_005619 [Streptacidiphilus sp. MAP12-16]|uniref:hypothetical protein n=1 Tax=Streptacidiphilus sp. MAP12-16 TaxID=3156300 RepID=UPI003513B2F8
MASALLSTMALASPAYAAASGCTHNWDGPQICIDVVGPSVYLDHVTATWTNPPKNLQTDPVREIYWSSNPRDAPWVIGAVAHRHGGTLTYTFNERGTTHYSDVKVCVEFGGSKRRACEDIIARDQ